MIFFMQQESQKKYKEILESHNFSITDEEFFELVKEVETLANLISRFEKRKNKSPPKK